MYKKDKFEENCENDYDDIVTSVIKSIKVNAIDYCYTKKAIKDILVEAQRLKLSVVYVSCTDEKNDFNYFKIIPVKFYQMNGNNFELIEGKCYEVHDIPLNLQCFIFKDKKSHIFKLLDEPIKNKDLIWIKKI